MAKANLLQTGTATYLDLIGNGRMYRVPPYQRDYSWTEEQWEDIWNDILEMSRRSDDIHYMGALVVEFVSDREFSVIDGQQRLATLSLLTLACIRKLNDLSANNLDDPNHQRAVALRSRFIGEKDPASLVEASKLRLNHRDDPFYQDYLVQLRVPSNPRSLPKSNRLLWDCFQYFFRKIGEWAERAEDGQKIASLVSEIVGRQLVFIRIGVDNEVNAYTVFETLNARGLELSATDLLKNYMFSLLPTEADREALLRRWLSLMSTVRQERFPEFLRNHLQCEFPRVRSQRLFKLVRDRVRSGAEVFSLMDHLEKRAEIYSALFDPNHEFWIERPESAPYVKELNVLRVKQMTPLIFSVCERIPNELGRVLKLLTVMLFRYSAVSNLNTNELEPAFHLAARDVLDGRATSAADVFRRLRGVYVDDDRFRSDFALFSANSEGQSKKLVRYILAKLETDASRRLVDHETDPFTVEHILPENPMVAWDEPFPPETRGRYTYRIGNLTPLERSFNRQIGNEGIQVKLIDYERSVYALTRSLPEELGESWTPAKLEQRQRRLAARAVHIWRAEFA